MNASRPGYSLTLLSAALSCLFAATPATAGTAEDLAALRGQLEALKNSYESRIAALEKRLAAAETQASKAESVAVATHAKATAAAMPASSESAFNPSLSLILNGTYTNLSRDPNTYRIGGFAPTGGEVAPGPRSFGLGESELTVAANIDHLFRGQLTAAIAPEGGTVQVEESFIQTLGLGAGATVKAGRFLSGFGYLNEQHAHTWDFADAPLVYKALFGGPLKNDGVQLKWLAPTESTLLEFGLEAARGGPFPSTDRNRNGATTRVAFARLGGDLGESQAWRVGLSHLTTSAADRPDDAAAPSFTFTGNSQTTALDFVWKWAPNGNSTQTNFKLQGEWMQRRESGDLSVGAATGAYESRQSGWYLQGVYQFMPRWRVGVRHDRMNYGSISAAVPTLPTILEPWNPKRTTLMADWSPSEFSRLRLQFARDESRPFEPDNQIWFQYIMSLGAHGAHRF